MAEKLQIGIYRLKDKFIELVPDKKPREVMVDVKYLTSLFKDKGFKSQKVKSDLSERYKISLFYKKSFPDVKWKDFIGNIAEADEAIVKDKKTTNESYVLLLENSEFIYATTGGFAHMVLQGIVDNDFGIKILSRLIKAEDKTLRSTKERNLLGGILGEVKFFRNDYNLYENEAFGNFYQELHSSLDKKILINTFGFSSEDIDSGCLCVAKNSFTIKKSIAFDELLRIIGNCEDLIKNTDPQVDINGVEKLNRNDKVLISELKNKLDDILYNFYSTGTIENSIDISHKDFDRYYHADKFIFKFRHFYSLYYLGNSLLSNVQILSVIIFNIYS